MTAEVRISQTKTLVKDGESHMRAATRELRELLEQNPQLKSNFTEKQLANIKSGKAQIEGYTWHHH